MSDQKDRMLRGDPYQDSDPELVADRRRCQALLDRFNATLSGQDDVRQEILAGVVIGSDTVVGAGSVVTRDLPERVFAAGNPWRVIRPL